MAKYLFITKNTEWRQGNGLPRYRTYFVRPKYGMPNQWKKFYSIPAARRAARKRRYIPWYFKGGEGGGEIIYG